MYWHHGQARSGCCPLPNSDEHFVPGHLVTPGALGLGPWAGIGAPVARGRSVSWHSHCVATGACTALESCRVPTCKGVPSKGEAVASDPEPPELSVPQFFINHAICAIPPQAKPGVSSARAALFRVGVIHGSVLSTLSIPACAKNQGCSPRQGPPRPPPHPVQQGPGHGTQLGRFHRWQDGHCSQGGGQQCGC